MPFANVPWTPTGSTFPAELSLSKEDVGGNHVMVLQEDLEPLWTDMKTYRNPFPPYAGVVNRALIFGGAIAPWWPVKRPIKGEIQWAATGRTSRPDEGYLYPRKSTEL